MIPTQHSTGNDARYAWAERSRELAGWTWTRLVNRHDAWGGYRPLHLRDENIPNGKIWTKPAKSERGQKVLTEEILARHFAGRDVGHLIGLHSTSPENTSRWAAVDIDHHSDQSTDPRTNQAAALGWYQKLAALGFAPLLTDSNGEGGFHLLAIFAEPIATKRVLAFVRWLVSDHGQYGLPSPPETYPKQARIKPGRYGNRLRLPGRHHTKDHWSRVWNGQRWLEGGAAIDRLIVVEGASQELIPLAARAFLPPEPARQVVPQFRPVRPVTDGLHGLTRRIQAYVARLPNLCEGQGRDDIAYRLAAFLVRDLELSDDSALPWLRQWDAGNQPPKGDARLREIIQSAHTYGTRAYGCGYRQRSALKPGHGFVRFSMRV
jgi:hypothetical protein